MSVPGCTICHMKQNWFKYTYVCSICDALIEITNKTNIYAPHICCDRESIWLSVEDVTIHHTDSPLPTKEEQMETTTQTIADTSSQSSMAEHYNNHAVMIVKDTNQQEMIYTAVSPYDVNVLMTDNHYYKQRLEKFTSKFNLIEENMTEDGWYNPNIEKSEVLSDLCEILGITPSKTINFSGTMSFSGTIEVPFDELEDFDLQYLLQDEVYLTSNHGNLEIDSYEVESVSEDY